MTTIKDIARISGVSHGTVSNVLNKRGNVSTEKIELVERAAKEMGFQLNTQAQLLRKGTHKLICVILPSLNRRRYLELYDVIVNEARNENYDVSLYITNNREAEEKKILELCYAQHATCIVCVSSIKDGEGVFQSNIRHIFVDRKPKCIPDNSLYVGFDFKSAAIDIFENIQESKSESIVFIAGEYSLTDKIDFSEQLREMSKKNKIVYEVVEGNEAMLYRSLFFRNEEHQKLHAIVCVDREVKEIVERVIEMTDKQHVRVYSLTYADLFYDSNCSYYEMDYRKLGKLVYENITTTQTKSMIRSGKLVVTHQQEIQSEKNIKILMLDSPTATAIKSLLPIVKKERGLNVEVDLFSYDEMYTLLCSSISLEYDLIRLDLAWVNLFADKIYYDLSGNSRIEQLKKSIREHVPPVYFSTTKKECMIPLDTCTQVLYYRKDLFEDASLQRAYYEQTKELLKIPETMRDFDQISKFFSRNINKNSPVEYGCTVVCGANDVLSADIMPRILEQGITFEKYGDEFDFRSSKLNTVIDQYVENIPFGHSKETRLWSEAATTFCEGKAAMMIIFSNHGVNLMNTNDSKVKGKIGVAQIPGKHPLLGGGVLGICEESNKKEEALDFLEWLYSEEIICKLIFLGAIVPSNYMNSNYKIIENYPWLESFDESYQSGSRTYDSFDLMDLEAKLGAYIRTKIK